MNNWKVMLATLVIFGAGVVTGGLLVNHVQTGRIRPPPFPGLEAGQPPRPLGVPDARPAPPRDPNLPGGLPQRLGEGLLLRMDQEMQLTPGQRERVRDIIADGQERLRQANETLRPLLQKEMQETRRRIREILTPEQQERFEELMKPRPHRRPDEPFKPERRLRDGMRSPPTNTPPPDP